MFIRKISLIDLLLLLCIIGRPFYGCFHATQFLLDKKLDFLYIFNYERILFSRLNY